MYAAGIGVNVSQPKALIHLTIGALGNSTWGQMALGYRYWAGVTVPAACDKALYFYRKVATKGNSRSIMYNWFLITYLILNIFH